jgi:hypothetical protein
MDDLEALLSPYREKWPTRAWQEDANGRLENARKAFVQYATQLMVADWQAFEDAHARLERSITVLRYATETRRMIERAMAVNVEPIQIVLENPYA